MYFVTAFLFFLAIYFGISGFRHGDHGSLGLALGFFVAGVGTVLVIFFAQSVL